MTVQTRDNRPSDDERPSPVKGDKPRSEDGVTTTSAVDKLKTAILERVKLPTIKMPAMKMPSFGRGGEDASNPRARAERPAVNLQFDAKKFALPAVLVVIFALLIGSPILVRLLQPSFAAPLQPGWYNSALTNINFRLAPPSWSFMSGNLGMFLPWVLWVLNVPLLLWQLKKERTLAKEMNDWWLVLFAAVLFWVARTSALQFGATIANTLGWFGDGTSIVPDPSVVIVATAFVTAAIGAYASWSGQKDLTPFSMICVVIAIIWKAYDQTSDGSWSKIFMFVGVIAGILEIVRQPSGRRGSDRAGAFGLVVGMLVVFAVAREVIVYTIRFQFSGITNPPAWFVEPGRLIYANSAVIAILGAALLAWSLRFMAGRLLFSLLAKMSTKNAADLARLSPDPNAVKFWDTTILSHFAILAVWLFMGAL